MMDVVGEEAPHVQKEKRAFEKKVKGEEVKKRCRSIGKAGKSGRKQYLCYLLTHLAH